MSCRLLSRRIAVFFLAAASLLPATFANATNVDAPAILNPGQSVAVPIFEASAGFVTTQTETFGGGAGPSGTLIEYVLDNGQYNPFGSAADLVFAFSFSVTSGDVAQIVLPGYSGLSVAVKACNDAVCVEGPGTPPDTAERSANGDLVTFLWSTALTGNSSGFAIYTNATNYTDPTAEICNSNGDCSSAQSFVPSATPLPAALPLFATGLGALGLLARRRKRRA